MGESETAKALFAAAGEWMKGCSCATAGYPMGCRDCSDAFLQAVHRLMSAHTASKAVEIPTAAGT